MVRLAQGGTDHRVDQIEVTVCNVLLEIVCCNNACCESNMAGENEQTNGYASLYEEPQLQYCLLSYNTRPMSTWGDILSKSG